MITATRTDETTAVRERVDALVAHHPVVERNRYTAWFSGGAATRGEVRHLTVQFSVFSHLFVEAQLRKVINAADLDIDRAGKEILLNELGVVFNADVVRADQAPTRIWWRRRAPSTAGGSASVPRTSSGCSGSRRPWAWASTISASVATAPDRRCSSATSSLRLTAQRMHRSPRARRRRRALGGGGVLEGAHRRARGLPGSRVCERLPLAFWTWHDKVEDQHAAHTSDEVEVGVRLQPWFDAEAFAGRCQPDAGWRPGVLGRLVGRPRGGCRAMTAVPAAPSLGGIDHLEWWVGNARAFSGFLASAFGFDLVGYAGPETGRRDRVKPYLLEQGRARFMVSGALTGQPHRGTRPHPRRRHPLHLLPRR